MNVGESLIVGCCEDDGGVELFGNGVGEEVRGVKTKIADDGVSLDEATTNDTVGDSDAEAVGVEVGSSVVGVTVGTSVGASDGEIEVISVAVSVGTKEGVSVAGVAVGKPVGIFVVAPTVSAPTPEAA